MSDIFYQPKSRMFSNDGAIGAGYKFYFYQTGTTTPITTYSDQNLTTPNTNPVIADEYGYFNIIYVSDFSQVKVIVKDSNDNLIYEVDPVNPQGSSSITLNDLGVRPTSYWGLTAGTASAYTLAANPTLMAYSNYNTFFVQFKVACNAAPTLDVDSLGPKNLKKYTGQGTKVALQAGDVQASQRYVCAYDGVDIMVLNPRNTNIYTGTAPTLTIATGVITITNGGASYTIDTEASAATDDLDTINGGVIGEIIIIGTANSSRDVVLKNGTGNIVNPSGIDITLGTTNDQAVLKYNGTNWILIAVNALGSTPVQLLQTQTASNVATISFTNLSSVYSEYEIKFQYIVPISNSYFSARLSIDNGATYASANYLNGNIFGSNADVPTGGAAPTDRINLSISNVNMINTSTKGFCGSIRIFNPSSSSSHKICRTSGNYTNTLGNITYVENSSIYTGATTAVNAIQFFFSTGNISAGTFKLYGIV